MVKQSSSSDMKTDSQLVAELPSYVAEEGERTLSEKEGGVACPTHGVSKTPLLDTHLRQPNTKAQILALSSALKDAVDENCCSQCASERATRALTGYLRDLRTAKKSGEWSAEEKRAFKLEAKGLFKDLKSDAMSVWKEKA